MHLTLERVYFFPFRKVLLFFAFLGEQAEVYFFPYAKEILLKSIRVNL